MLDNFLQHPLPNTLAVVVLIALVVSWFASITLALKDTSISISKGWFHNLILLISMLGIPALWDVLQTEGIAFVFAVIATFAIALNIAIPLLQAYGKSSHILVRDWSKWSIPILVIGGLAVAGYFTYLEATRTQVVCGPSQGCDAVQNSKYAVLLGVIPMGMFGLTGYFAILAGWLLWQFGPTPLRRPGSLSMWEFSIFGVLFSAYLTFLEPFVIGATCMWCILSAVFMIILLMVSTPAAQQASTITEESEPAFSNA
ncbi:MAG: vitamin K epoxide reductase family protein [Chloroflexota bacterium]